MKHTATAKDSARFDLACDWFLRLREAPESAELVSAWLSWCRTDPLNREAFEEVRTLWQATGLMTPRANLEAQRLAVTPVPATRWRGPPARWLGAAVALLIAVAGLNLALRHLAADSAAAAVTYTAAPKERRGFQLADGTSVDLAADSVLRATYSTQRRELQLLRGEAYFRVVPDRTRPFVVHAGAFHVRAIGTSFDVRRSADRVVVAVEEGAVVVEAQPRKPGPLDSVLGGLGGESGWREAAPVQVRGGQELAVGTPDREVELTPIEPEAVAAWRDGRLRFVREPLHAVIERIRAVTGRDIQLADPQLGELSFTGTVFSMRIEAWAQGLPEIFPIEVREESGTLLIAPRQ